MIGVLYCCSIDKKDSIQLSREHSEGKWVSAEQIGTILPNDHWLKHAVERAELLRLHLSPEIIALNRQSTLEI